MSLKERIAADLKQAMLDKDELARDALRMVKTELTNREIELERELTDEDMAGVLAKAVKSREESAQQYEQGGRTDAAARERQEAALIQRYLPQQLDEGQTRAAAETVVAELGLAGKKDMGRLMKELKSRHGAALDGKLAARVAGELLGG